MADTKEINQPWRTNSDKKKINSDYDSFHFKLQWMFQPLFNCISEVATWQKRKTKQNKTQRLEDQPLSEKGRKKISACVMTHLALGVWCNNKLTAEKRWLKKHTHTHIRDGILKDSTNLSFFRAIISIFFLVIKFSKLKSIYSNSSEIFSVYFWGCFSHGCFLSTIPIYFKIKRFTISKVSLNFWRVNTKFFQGVPVYVIWLLSNRSLLELWPTTGKEWIWKVHCKIFQVTIQS